ncbi:hypothetical protein D3C76_1148060 [compost metagenome]
MQTLFLERNDWVPNKQRLPVLIYPKAIAIMGKDPAAQFEKTFSANGWPPQWRYGVCALASRFEYDLDATVLLFVNCL